MGVGVAVLEDAAVVETEVPLLPEGTILAEVEPVIAAVVEAEVEVPVVKYMLRRFGPPQYSMGFPEQTMLHCVLAGIAPTTSAEPALMMFPQ